MSATTLAPRSVGLDDDSIRPLVRDLHKVNRTTYWADFIASSLIGWAAFAAALSWASKPWEYGTAIAVAVLGLYRSLCFVHELSHQTERTLPGFEFAFNAIVGFPLLMPSFIYVGMHQNHHRVDLYGTANDPEYLPFSKSWLMTTVFAAESFLIPLILLIRFVLLAPVGFVSQSFHQWLCCHLSSLTMNPAFRRKVTPGFVSKVRRHSMVVFSGWAVALVLSTAGFLTWRWLAIWLTVDSLISFLNTLRTLGAHAYESNGEQMDREAQLHDSIDTPGMFWTELWAPVGLRYHALHHYFPGIPYHNLPEAYRRIVSFLPVAADYRKMSSPSLVHSLRELIRRGFEKR